MGPETGRHWGSSEERGALRPGPASGSWGPHPTALGCLRLERQRPAGGGVRSGRPPPLDRAAAPAALLKAWAPRPWEGLGGGGLPAVSGR